MSFAKSPSSSSALNSGDDTRILPLTPPPLSSSSSSCSSAPSSPLVVGGSAPSQQPPNGHRRKISLGQRIQNVVRKSSANSAGIGGSGNPFSGNGSALSSPGVANSADENPYNLTVTLEPTDYELIRQIGYGSSATVYLARFIPQNKEVAIKCIDLDLYERNQIEELRKELQIMTLSRHPKLLPVYGSFVHGQKLYIVMPYLSIGSCLDVMKSPAFSEGLEETACVTILKQCLQGLNYLHKNGHIHRDVKAGNLLMDQDGRVLLADFGVSSSLTEGGERKGQRRTFVGTPCWMAPEVLSPEKGGYDEKADIWSFGITALELAYGQAPYAQYPPLKVLMLTMQHDPPRFEQSRAKFKFSKSFQQMVEACLQKDPKKRPSADKLLEYSVFKLAKPLTYLSDKVVSQVEPIGTRSQRRSSVPSRDNKQLISWDFSTLDDALKQEESEAVVASETIPSVSVSAINPDADFDCEEEVDEVGELGRGSPKQRGRFKINVGPVNTSRSTSPQQSSLSAGVSPRRGRFELTTNSGLQQGQQRRSVRFASPSPSTPSDYSPTNSTESACANNSNVLEAMEKFKSTLSKDDQKIAFAELESSIRKMLKQ